MSDYECVESCSKAGNPLQTFPLVLPCLRHICAIDERMLSKKRHSDVTSFLGRNQHPLKLLFLIPTRFK